jgi:hypothetical protein
MSIQKYKTVAIIEFIHEYFTDKQCPLILQPSMETNKLLMKNGILLRKQNHNWLLLIMEKDFDFIIENVTFEFDIICPDNRFYYYTIHRNHNETNWNMEYIGTNGVYSRLKLSLDKNPGVNAAYIPIYFESPHKYWEFILIPKFTGVNSKIKLTEDKNRIQFNSPERIKFHEKEDVFRITTTEAILIKEKYEYKLRLWEVLNDGEKILSNSIQCPTPLSSSSISEKDTITSYIYY